MSAIASIWVYIDLWLFLSSSDGIVTALYPLSISAELRVNQKHRKCNYYFNKVLGYMKYAFILINKLGAVQLIRFIDGLN